MKTISKQEAAKRWGVVPSMVTKYIAKGLPVTATGKINWKVAQQWRKRSITPSASGSFAARQRKHEEPPAQYSPLLDDEALTRAAYRTVLDRILSRRHLVAGILAAVGIRDAALLHCADDLFAALVCGFIAEIEDQVYPLNGDDIPLVKTDIDGVFRECGLELTPEIVDNADRMADAAYEAIERAEGAGCES